MPRLSLISCTLALALMALRDPSLALPCDAGHVEVRGRIMDSDPASPDGVACCEVLTDIRGAPCRVVTTAPDGSWTTCFTWPATPECPRWALISAAECCDSVISHPVIGCPPPANPDVTRVPAHRWRQLRRTRALPGRPGHVRGRVIDSRQEAQGFLLLPRALKSARNDDSEVPDLTGI